MRRVGLIIALSLIFFNSFGQKNQLIGKWQAESATITSMYFDSYQFLPNGRFIFNPNAYNGLNRIVSIEGRYKFKNDVLYMTPLFTREIVGGFVIRSESTMLSDTWEIIRGNKKKILIKKKFEQKASLKINTNKTFELDGRLFFKIEL